jgi:tetratricopeptide (TPR) repeat protein
VPAYQLFLSYARADNRPPTGDDGGPGWVTAFHDRLKAQHARNAGRDLAIFFDRHSIREGNDWRSKVYEGLRTSTLFIAFLSPAYLKSAWCRREWEEYLRLEHRIARGNDGILPIYLVRVPELHPSPQEAAAVDAWIADLKRRQRGGSVELIDWYAAGPSVLAEIDAAERLAELRANPQKDGGRLLSLAERIAAIDKRIALRLDRVALAELALDHGRVEGSYAHFVGRHRELRELHDALTATERIGIVSALHGLGGQGKTALAVQYAYAYAEHYAAGGRWKLSCEGRASLAEVLEQLVGLNVVPPPPREATGADKVYLILQSLKAGAIARVPLIRQQLSALPHLLAPAGELPEIAPHTLLILDNVDQPALLSAAEAAHLAAEDWLKIIVTTREPPENFGIADDRLKAISVDDLPAEDALALLREYRAFTTPEDEAAAREIVRRLGGFTLAVELIAAYLARKPNVGIAGYLQRLEAEGLAAADALAKDAKTADVVRHRQKQVGLIVDDAIAALSAPALEALAFASLLPPDDIVLPWVRDLAATAYPELAAEAKPGYPHPWDEAVAELTGRRLLLPAQRPGAAEETAPAWHYRMHRLVAEHVRGIIPAAARALADEAVIGEVYRFAGSFEHQWRHEPWLLALLRPLEETVSLLLERAPERRELAMAAGVAATAQLETGSQQRGERLLLASHTSLQRASAARPGDDEAQRLVAVSLERLGEFYVARGQQGDAERALAAFEQSLALRQRLLDANPGSAAAARDVSVSLERLGEFYVARGQQGDAERALAAFEQSLALRQRLRDANPGSAAAARDVAVSLNKLGDFYIARGQEGDAERALAAFEQSLALRQRLRDANPGSAAAARDVAVSHYMLARHAQAAGDEARAAHHLQACFAILDQFHRDRRPMDPQMRRLHARLAPMFSDSAPDTASEPDPAVPDELVAHIFADPEAHELLQQVMTANGLDGDPAALDIESQRAIVAMLIDSGIITFGAPDQEET